MTIEYRTDGHRSHYIVMSHCPCGHPLTSNRALKLHLLNDHRPEDFGLSPIGSTDGDSA